MPRGASPKREREYEELRDEFKDEGRYAGREEEVAARIVNKQRAEHGEIQGAQERGHEGNADDRDLPITGYDKFTVDQVKQKLDHLSAEQIRAIRRYEQQHQARKTLLTVLDRKAHER